MSSNKQKLEKFLELFSKESHVLVMINADPDAIASAMAVKRLLWRRVSEVTIAYFNEISRPDNLTMIRLLSSKMSHLKDIDEHRYNCFVAVDSQPDHHECFAMFRYDAIIDHHPISCDCARFNDIRPEYGSCSSIMTEYLKTAKIRLSAKLATALLMGIKTDTAGFLRESIQEDVRAFQYLFRFANTHVISRIENAVLTERDLTELARAINRKKIRYHRVFSHMGNIRNPDQCVIAADFFMRVATVNWSIVSGIYDGRLIIIMRNDGLRKSASKTAQEAFSSVGSAGGHQSMARAEIRQEDLEPNLDISRWIIERVEKFAGKKTR